MSWRRSNSSYQATSAVWERTGSGPVLLYSRGGPRFEAAGAAPPLLIRYSATAPSQGSPEAFAGGAAAALFDEAVAIRSEAADTEDLAGRETVPVALLRRPTQPAAALGCEAPVVLALEGAAADEADEASALLDDPLLGDELPPPAGVTVRGRTWSTPPPDAQSSLACAAFIGPSEVIEEGKDNEDFAFAVSCVDARGAPWLVCGVADGTSNGCWQRRGAQHACAAFLTVVKEILCSPEDTEKLGGPDMAELFAPRFTAHMRSRLAADMDRILHERAIPPNFRKNPALYFDYFFDSEDSAEQRLLLWFQTTLLAAALGPAGGMALTIGDGLVRWDRRNKDVWQSQWIEPSAVISKRRGFGTGGVIATQIEQSLVQGALHQLPAEGAREMRILTASDGVGDISQNNLESAWFPKTVACARYLVELAAHPPDTLQPDNMSIACAGRRLVP